MVSATQRDRVARASAASRSLVLSATERDVDVGDGRESPARTAPLLPTCPPLSNPPHGLRALGRPTRSRAPSSTSAVWWPEPASPAGSGRGSRARRRRAAREPRQRLSKVISPPAGVTWRLREGAATGNRRAREWTVAWTDQPFPSASSSKPPRSACGPLEARERLRQRPVLAAAVHRRERVDRDERHARLRPARAGEHDRRREHLVVGPDGRLAVADQPADRDRQRPPPAQRARQPLAAPGAARWNHRTASSTVVHGAARSRPAAARRRRPRARTPRRPRSPAAHSRPGHPIGAARCGVDAPVRVPFDPALDRKGLTPCSSSSRHQPDWLAALGVALTRPPAFTERRRDEDPWHPDGDAPRPRRIADDLAWLRQAFDEPETNGLKPLPESAAVAAWDPNPECSSRLDAPARPQRARRGRLPAARGRRHRTGLASAGVDLRQLEYFAAVARHRHFTRAAEELYVTQPALCQQVRRLERELGLELLRAPAPAWR